jgi:hypothetical protein
MPEHPPSQLTRKPACHIQSIWLKMEDETEFHLSEFTSLRETQCTCVFVTKSLWIHGATLPRFSDSQFQPRVPCSVQYWVSGTDGAALITVRRDGICFHWFWQTGKKKICTKHVSVAQICGLFTGTFYLSFSWAQCNNQLTADEKERNTHWLPQTWHACLGPSLLYLTSSHGASTPVQLSTGLLSVKCWDGNRK